ncbi:MAG TPA: DUF4136 domain-containing protein [Gammaproteobacteria bacterium]|nr:DUF4136 domain-containing protein [Gammaproteobacteria bacterium]
MNNLAKSRLSPYISLLAAIALTGCAGVPVNTDFEHGAPFARLHTFTWRAPASRTGKSTPVWDNEIFGQRVARAVRADLTSQGYKSVHPPRADFIVTYSTAQRERMRGSSVGFGYWTGPWFLDQSVAFQSYQENTLILDVIDARTGQLIWRGWSSGIIDEDHMDTKTVTRVVDAILKEFPPH